MENLLKAVVCVLITIILTLVLDKQERDISVLLVIFVCCAVFISTIAYLKPVINFFRKLQDLSNLDSNMLTVILKTVGIGLLGELTGNICTDAGKAALGKALQILTTSVILWLAVPLFTQMIELIESILGAV